MASPVTGPFNKGFELRGPVRPSGFSPPNFQKSQTWFRQKPPYDQPLYYSSYSRRLVSEKFFNQNHPDIAANAYWVLEDWTPLGDLDELRIASEKAYSRLVEKVSSYSQWANNVLEARKPLAAIADRAKQLLSFTKKLKRLDFIGAARVLRMATIPKGVSVKKSLADNWLAYHFGWEQLLKDIYAGIEALTRDFGVTVVKGSGSSHKTSTIHTPGIGPDDFVRETIWMTHKVRQCCNIRIVNPNATLLNDLGLANPVAVLWEAVPFSFVVDWFSTVGAVIASATDFLGVAVTGAFRSYLIKTGRTRIESVTQVGPNLTVNEGAWEGVNAGRTLGLVGPELHLKPFKGFSTTRGGTAIALLIQFLPK